MADGQERVVGYVRVSTEGQADGGVSLEAQRAKLRAYAVALDLDLIEIIEDAGYSAKSIARPGLQRALEHLAAGRATGLLVTKLDRLTRSVRDLGDLVERYFGTKHSLLSVGDAIDTRTAAGRLVLNVLTSVAQWEREAGGERTREALAHLKREGVRLGPAALGWSRSEQRDTHGRLTVREVDEEATTVAMIVSLRTRGLSLRAIASALEREGRPTKKGGTWRAVTIHRVLRRASRPERPSDFPFSS